MSGLSASATTPRRLRAIRSSFHQVHGAPQKGDVATDGKHVGIVSGPGRTVSVSTRDSTLPDYGCVVENDWGFRHNQKSTVSYWRHRNQNAYKR